MENKLVLGTVQFGMSYGINNNNGQPSTKEVFEILDLAFDSGIKVLDTANAYGTATDLIGNYHRSGGKQFKVISKFHLPQNNLNIHVLPELEKLGIESFEAYLFHSFNEYERAEKTVFKILETLKLDGKIKKIGVSIYTNEQFEKAALDDRIDLIQLPFNLLDNSSQRGEIMDLAKNNGKELHTRSAFLQGLFFKPEADFPEKLKPLVPYIRQLKELANKNKMTLNQLSLNYPLEDERVEHVLIGVDSIGQLKQNMKDKDQGLTRSCIEEINAIHVKEKELLNPVNWKE